jgi:hypothetical protein
MKKLTFRLLALILTIYLAGSILPLFASEGGHGHSTTPSTPPPPPPPPPPVGTPAPQLGGPQAQPAGPPPSDDPWLDQELNKPKTRLGVTQQRPGTTCG